VPELISKIGAPGFALLLILLIYFILRTRKATETNYCLLFLFLSKLVNPIIAGFSFSQGTKLFIGQLNTVTSYIFLIMAASEIVISKKKQGWQKSKVIALVGLSLISISFLFWKLYAHSNFALSDFLFLITLIIFILTGPSESSKRILAYVSATLLSIVFLCATLRYQNPFFPYYQADFGIDGPYHNFMWDFFGLTERFRGPYISPNICAYNIVFLSVLIGEFKTKIFLPSMVLSITLLLLTGSKISLISIALYLFVKTLNRITENQKKWKDNRDIAGSSDNKSRSTEILVFVMFILVVYLVLRLDPTLNGRTSNYSRIISNLNGNYLFGNGPTLSDSINSAENTYITLISYYGFVGFLSIVFILGGLYGQYFRSELKIRNDLRAIFVPFLITSMGEAILGGGSYDLGLLYVLLMLSHSKVHK